MPKLIDVNLAFPDYYYSQDELLETFLHETQFSPKRQRLTKELYNSVQVKGRYLSRPIQDYQRDASFGERNRWWQETALELGTKAITELLTKHDLTARHIDVLCTTTVTGLDVPTLDARLMNRFEFHPNTKRMPFFGLGCVAGVSGLNRVAEYLQARPESCALFVAVELCTLTFQRHDPSIANILACSLFGDGCGAVLIAGDRHPLAKAGKMNFVGSQSHFFPNSEGVMGWDINENGFKIVLQKDVPQFVHEGLPIITERLCQTEDIALKDIAFVLAHPGGPKVIRAIEETWPFPQEYYADTWKNLEQCGNMSSVSVLTCFKDHLKKTHVPNSKGLSIAFGPGFVAELGLWENI